MKKAVLSLTLVLFLTACFPLTPAPPAPSPIVNGAGTAEAVLKTAIAQTLTAQPTGSPTPVLAESSATPSLPSEIPPTETETMTVTVAADPALAASTGTFEAITSTPLPATFVQGPSTNTLTPGVLTYGTLPPAVPFSYITLNNRSRTQAYISLQVNTAEGGPTIIEYPVRGRIKIQAPVGSYLYVAWVGGRKMVGEFRLRHDEDLELLLFRDRIEIR